MAYTAVITKQSVTKIGPTIYQATITMVVSDGVDEVFEASASAQYNSNSPDLNGVKSRLQAQLVEKWDKWVAEQDLFTAQAFDTMISQIQTAANGYINQ